MENPGQENVKKLIETQEEEADISKKVEFQDLIENMKDVFGYFSILPSKIQEDIIADTLNQHREGKSSEEVINRLRLMVAKGTELNFMTSEDSDKNYKPKPSPEEEKTKEEMEEVDELVVNSVDELVEKLEQIRQDGLKEESKKDWIN